MVGEALKRSSASMNEANNSLEETIALIATANEVTQNPESVGNALKTVSMRIRGIVTDEDEDGNSVLTPAKLGREIKRITAQYDKEHGVGVSIMADEDTFKSTYQILSELSEYWDDLKDTEKSYLLERISGKHRATQIAAILSNGEQLAEAYVTALESTGSAMTEFEKRTESIEYHLSQLNAAWQELATSSVTTEFVNGVIDGLRGFIEFVNSVGLKQVFGSIVTVLGELFLAFKAIPFFDAVGQDAILKNSKNLKTLKEQFVDFLSEIKKSGNIFAKFKPNVDVLAGIVVSARSAVKMLSKAAIVFGVANIAINFFQFIAESVDKFVNRTHYAKDEVEDLTNELKKLESEFDLLKTKSDLGNLTSAEQNRLDILKEEIALQKADLQLSQKRWAKTVSNKHKTSFTVQDEDGNDIVFDKDSAAEKTGKQTKRLARSYLDASAKVQVLYDEVARLNVILNDEESTTEQVNSANARMLEISKLMVEAKSAESSTLSSLQEQYDDLIEQQTELNGLLEWGTEADKENAKAGLEIVNADLEIVRALLGLEAENKEYVQEQENLISNSHDVVDAMEKMASAEGLTKKELEDLRKIAPDVADVIEDFATDTGDSYKTNIEVLDKLKIAYQTTFSSMNENQVLATEVALMESKARLEQLKIEAQAFSDLLSSNQQEIDAAQANIDSGNYTASDVFTVASGKLFNKINNNSLNDDYYSKKIAEATKDYELAEKKSEELYEALKKSREKIAGLDEDDDPLGDLDGKGLGDGDGDAADVFDKYANALANAREEVESYANAVELAQAQLDLNQSQEERTVDLLTQEQELYNTLLEAQQAQYKITNDTLWLQQQQLKTVQEQAKEKIQAVAPNYDVSDIENWTAADVEKFVTLHLDDSEADKDLANYLNSMVDMKDGVHELYVEWYNLKQELRETRKEELQSILDWQKDSLEQFDDARKQTEMLLDLLGEVEDTEQQRMNLAEGLAESYEAQKDSIVSMHEANARKMNELAGDLENNQELYQMLLKQNEELEENYLSALQAQLGYKQQLLELEQEYAEQMAETEIYGEQGQDRWEDARQDEIDALNDQIDSLRKKAEEDDYAEQMAEYEEELAEKQEEISELYKKLNNLRAQTTVQTLEEQADGSFQWKYVEDQIAINETLEEIADKEVEIEEIKNEMKEAEEERALEEEIEHLESQIEAIEDEVQRRQELFDQEVEIIEQTYQREKAQLSKWLQDEIANWQARITASEQNLAIYDQVNQEGWQTATENTNTALTELSQVYTDQFNYIMGVIKNYESTAMAAVARIHAAIAAAKRAAAEAESEASGGSGSHANGLKFVEANNYIARLHYGERVLTRQEAQQYNELEDDIKSGKLAAYFESAKVDAMNSISSSVSQSIGRVGGSSMPITNTTSTSFVIEHLELPNVQDSQDFAAVLQSWARNEFGGLAQKAKIVKAR